MCEAYPEEPAAANDGGNAGEANPVESGAASGGQRRAVGWWRVALLAALLAGLWYLGRRVAPGGMNDLRAWVARQGAWGPAAFIAARALAAVVLLPGSVLTMAAAPLLGLYWGIVCVSVGKTLGACAAFLISRYAAREPVRRWLSRKRAGARFENLVGDAGVWVVALMRLLPVVPFNVQNYGFGLTRVRFGTYVFWSWLCMLPSGILVVTAAEVTTRVAATGEVPWVLVGVLVGTVLLTVGLAMIAFTRVRAHIH